MKNILLNQKSRNPFHPWLGSNASANDFATFDFRNKEKYFISGQKRNRCFFSCFRKSFSEKRRKSLPFIFRGSRLSKFSLICLLGLLLFILTNCGRDPSASIANKEAGVVEKAGNIENVSQEKSPEKELEKQLICEYNGDCQQDFLCIEGACRMLSSLFETNCKDKCSISSAKISTSDKEVYDLTMGRGSYTFAGALEWRLMKTLPHCKDEDPLVAIAIIKKTTGKIIGEQVITLQEKEMSDIITHPAIKGISFTVTLESVNEQCS